MRKYLTWRNAASVVFALGAVAMLGGYWQVQQQKVNDLQQQIDQLPDGKDKVSLVKDRIALENTIAGSLIQGVGGGLLFVTAYVSWKNLKATQRNVLVAEEKQVTERFTQAINQLGTEVKEGEGDKIAIRLGGIYALERIARDSEKDHWTIMEVLTAFIRVKSPSEQGKLPDSGLEQSQKDSFPGITQDIQAALTVIGRREKRKETGKLDLSKTNCRDANLTNARLSGANLTSSKLSRANLSGADLRGANLHWTAFNEANLRNVDFTDADLRGASLRGAKRNDETKFDPKWELVYQLVNGTHPITGTDWDRKMGGSSQKKDFSEANLSGIYFHEADLSGANFCEANLSEAVLEYVIGSETNFSGANFSGATLRTTLSLSGANFSEANFSGAIVRSVDFKGANLTDAKFTDNTILEDVKLKDARLDKTDFRGADLRNADLRGANLRWAIIDEETKLDDRWRIVYRLLRMRSSDIIELKDLRGANLSGAYLRGVYFREADLSGADLSGADLYKAEFKGANLYGADLEGADFRRTSSLTPEQVKAAKNWEKAVYSEHFRQELGLPPASEQES